MSAATGAAEQVTRILHVSDLHFGAPAVLEQIDAIERAIIARHFDVVAVSGDFSQRARAGELQRAAVFMRVAREESRVIAVPGNHDVAWWFAPLGIGTRARLYENYRRYISDDLEPVLEIPGAYFAGLNTAHGVTFRTLTHDPHDISIIGDVTPEQLARLRERLSRAPAGAARIVVMHHNPVAGVLSERYGLKHPERVLKSLADAGADLVLCGHDHQEAVSYVEHTARGVVVSTAGTVSNRSRGGRPSSYNVITIGEREMVVVTRVWDSGARDFLPGPRQCFAR